MYENAQRFFLRETEMKECLDSEENDSNEC
jgi:hypothetical protein